MQSFGQKLKRERESRNTPLETISRTTQIGMRYLEALERDEFESLPGPRAFGKLYIRAYAEILGFDPRPLIAEYDEERFRRIREARKVGSLAPFEDPERKDPLAALLDEPDLGQPPPPLQREAVVRTATADEPGEQIETAAPIPEEPESCGTSQVDSTAETVEHSTPPSDEPVRVDSPPVPDEPPAPSIPDEPLEVSEKVSPDGEFVGTVDSIPAEPMAVNPHSYFWTPVDPRVRRGAVAVLLVLLPLLVIWMSGLFRTPENTAATIDPPVVEQSIVPGEPVADPPQTASIALPGPQTLPAPEPRTVPLQQSHLNVSEFGVGRDVRNHRLLDETTRFEEGQVAWFSTRVTGGQMGEVVKHVWLRDGGWVQTVELKLGGAHWRTRSRKTLWGPGNWSVEARDIDGNVLARSEFACVPRGS